MSVGVYGAAVGSTVGSVWLGASGGIAGAAIGHYVRKSSSHPELQAARQEALPVDDESTQRAVAVAEQPAIVPPRIHPETLLQRQGQGLDIVPALPEEFFCPIGLELMVDPVTDSLGYTYERALIEEWFSDGHSTSPVTNLELPNKNLVPNHCLRAMIMMANDKERQRVNCSHSVVQTGCDDFAC
jgi:hypothetical protein